MAGLAEMHCEKIKAGSIPLSASESQRLIGDLPGWQIVTKEDKLRIEKTYKFQDYRQALDFTQQVGRQPSPKTITPRF